MIEVKPYLNFDKAVYIDGRLLKAQLLEDCVITDGKLSVKCYTNKVNKHEYVNEIVNHPDYISHSTSIDAIGLETTTFVFKY